MINFIIIIIYLLTCACRPYKMPLHFGKAVQRKCAKQCVRTLNILPVNFLVLIEITALHNSLIRSNLDMYRGYESNCNQFHSFVAAFDTLEDAMNFCIATQVSLLHVTWPAAVLAVPSYVLYKLLITLCLK